MPLERWFYTVPLRLPSLFRRKQVEQELAEEFRYHIERQIPGPFPSRSSLEWTSLFKLVQTDPVSVGDDAGGPVGNKKLLQIRARSGK